MLNQVQTYHVALPTPKKVFLYLPTLDPPITTKRFHATAVIHCLGLDPAVSLSIYFLPEGSNELANFYDIPRFRAAIFVPSDHYVRYLDILRNEKPVYMNLDSQHPENIGLSTSTEPVGEGELGVY